MLKDDQMLQRKYHISPEMNDEQVLSLFTKKPMRFGVPIGSETAQYAHIPEIEEDFGYRFRKVIRCPKQVHGCRVVTIDESSLDMDPGPADGLVTDLKGVALEIRTADCQSIFLYDPVRKVIGNVHSGWRGTLQGIVVRAVSLMQSKYSCRPADIRAYINPSILSCCFEVEDDVVSQFAEVTDVWNYCRKTGIKNGRQKYHMDTAAINRDALLAAGLLTENILLSGLCTVCRHEEFHSYRADAGVDGKYGLNMGIICLR